MGIATGCMGMSLNDFFQCTPVEFHAISAAWRDYHTSFEQAAWERSRFVAATLLQPHSRNTIRPKDICVFAWEKKILAEGESPESGGERSTRERFEEIKRRWGK